MTKSIDTLEEACRVAGVVAGEEKEVEMIEKEIADMFRATCRKIFSESEFRMPTHVVGIYVYDDGASGKRVWKNLGIVLDNQVEWNGNFRGSAKTLRVTVQGDLISVWQRVPRCQEYDLFDDNDYTYPVGLYYSEAVRPATDHEIAVNAVELAADLLNALRRRIDSAKEEKEELRRIAGLGPQK